MHGIESRVDTFPFEQVRKETISSVEEIPASNQSGEYKTWMREGNKISSIHKGADKGGKLIDPIVKTNDYMLNRGDYVKPQRVKVTGFTVTDLKPVEVKVTYNVGPKRVTESVAPDKLSPIPKKKDRTD